MIYWTGLDRAGRWTMLDGGWTGLDIGWTAVGRDSAGPGGARHGGDRRVDLVQQDGPDHSSAGARRHETPNGGRPASWNTGRPACACDGRHSGGKKRGSVPAWAPRAEEWGRCPGRCGGNKMTRNTDQNQKRNAHALLDNTTADNPASLQVVVWTTVYRR